jgi:hypothetical protein
VNCEEKGSAKDKSSICAATFSSYSGDGTGGTWVLLFQIDRIVPGRSGVPPFENGRGSMSRSPNAICYETHIQDAIAKAKANALVPAKCSKGLGFRWPDHCTAQTTASLILTLSLSLSISREWNCPSMFLEKTALVAWI